jgi:hypothetical protein
MRSSVNPSLKYSCSGSLLKLLKGSTAMEGDVSASGTAAIEGVSCEGAIPGCSAVLASSTDGLVRIVNTVMAIAAASETRPMPIQSKRFHRLGTLPVSPRGKSPLVTRNARTGLSIFLTLCSPRYS